MHGEPEFKLKGLLGVTSGKLLYNNLGYLASKSATRFHARYLILLAFPYQRAMQP